MFKVNDYVIYKSTGVYKIVDIVKEDIHGIDIEYYVIQPVYGNNLTIKAPVKTAQTTMRKTMTKEDVLSLIATMPEQETIWIEDDRQRNEYFKDTLKNGNSEEWVKLIKTLYLEKQKKSDAGKKLMKTDEQIMKAAEKNLYEEFAVALNISPDEVVSYIRDHV